jgi:hypothetical protein
MRRMELPAYDELGALRLRDFLRRGVRDLTDWEYAGKRWVGEAAGFTEVLRLERDPEVVRSVALDLVKLPSRVQARLLEALGLPLRRGATLAQLRAVLGKPRSEHSFVPDRTTYEFRVGTRWRYRISCTVLRKGGLVYLTMMAARR